MKSILVYIAGNVTRKDESNANDTYNYVEQFGIFRGGSRINFRVLQNVTKKIENRNDVTMQKNYRFSKKQEGMVLITVRVQI